MKITREQAICIMRRVMDRAELDGALHLDAGADEIVAGLALLQGRRVETAPQGEWRPIKVGGLTYEYDTAIVAAGSVEGIIGLHTKYKVALPRYIRIHPAEADRYDPPKEANPIAEGRLETATEMRMRLDEYRRNVADALRQHVVVTNNGYEWSDMLQAYVLKS